MLGLSELGIYASAFGVALLGSGHCFAMCGGLAAFAGSKRVPTYQFGRLLGYASLGGVCGYFGKNILTVVSGHPEIQLGFSVLFSMLILFQAIAWWRGSGESSAIATTQSSFFKKLFGGISRFASRKGGSFGLGLGTALLPCGWIATFGIAAAATGSPVRGSVLFAMLWLGSLPALLAATVGLKFARTRFSGKAWRKAMAVGMASIAFASFAFHYQSHSHSHGVSGDRSAEISCGPSEPNSTLNPHSGH